MLAASAARHCWIVSVVTPGNNNGGAASPPRLSASSHDTLNKIVKKLRISQMDIRRLGMARSTVFISNRSQAVRLPKAVAFPEGVHQVEIIRLGNSRLITPIGQRWDEFFTDGPPVSEDFMSERDQPSVQEREPL
jgi:antitoxin VapB